MRTGKNRLAPPVKKLLFSNMRKAAFSMLAIFVAGLFIGCAVAYAVLYFSNKEEYSSAAEEMNGRFYSGMGLSDSYQMRTMIFGEDGKLLLERGDDTVIAEPDWVYSHRVSNLNTDEPHFWLTFDTKTFRFYIIVLINGVTPYARSIFLSIYYIWQAPVVSVTFISFIISYCIIFALSVLLVMVYHVKLAEMENMRRDYVSNVSHELKTPIASIKALTESLSDGMAKDQEQRARFYGIILSEANRLERCVLNILELNRLQTIANTVQKEWVNARGLLEPLCDRFKVVCCDLDVRFCADVLDMELPDLFTDAHRLNEMMEILLENAVKFTADENGEVRLSAKRSRGMVTFCVSDNGIGIDRKHLPHIFERFYKVSENAAGSGLGLAIASEIVKQLGEQLWVKSEPGKGSQFFFTVKAL